MSQCFEDTVTCGSVSMEDHIGWHCNEPLILRSMHGLDAYNHDQIQQLVG